MAKQPPTVKRQRVAFASSEKPGSSAPGIRLNPDRYAATSVKLLDADELLENSLVNNNVISEPLTRREMQILQLIVAGKTNKQIAQKLCRSQRTIEYHRNRLMRKLSAHSAAELVKRAIAVGIV